MTDQDATDSGASPDVVGCPLIVIGVVRTGRTTTEETPVQSSLNRAEQGRIEVAAEYVDGLDGLDGFDYAWLVTWLHRPHVRTPLAEVLRQVPFLMRRQGRRVGVFAMRGPRRVNPLGLSLIRIRSIDGGTITFAGVDVLDGTPVVDLKPYVARFDRPGGDPRCECSTPWSWRRASRRPTWAEGLDLVKGMLRRRLTPRPGGMSCSAKPTGGTET